ncbi:SRS domain-containing protein [Neospora caninum Liverpool]|uniref:SRS domain-containing protein n=1 Tax=Neospora caninum (strain Liverpool) TaxID=572307 RepID=F0VM88_NEOCL|nr:SRS domain-containing protein [Neospora caninum Liverpool]CBZ54366.1 SRS domain-containing protein [Neospora caninum Liverpool]CEL69072.1 TPA: SRS domain-containing protein [Neospora caninum Liverpool]|eukprot:XP_003884396.1 SRS domain-containing protein [Neospora caninum Liverpool]
MARTAKMDRRREGFKSRARKLMVVCMGGVFLLSGGVVAGDYLREGTLQRNLQALSRGATQSPPNFDGQVATCVLTGGQRSETQTPTALTLSKENLAATLRCTGANNEAVPQEMTEVCSATVTSPTVATCKGTNSGGTRVALNTLLGSSRGIVWQKTSPTAEPATNGEERTLQLQETDLPLSDKAFFVGCDKKSTEVPEPSPTTGCRVDVNVKARPSSVADNNVVICAYGKDSNPEPLHVEMTTDKNTLTIQCGSEGSLNPESYATRYCDLQGELENCASKSFQDILTTFATSWWSKGDDSRSATLTIPQTDFPESEQQFRVGCVYKNETSGGPKPAAKGAKTGEAHAAATTSNCNVIVTVRSGSANSSSGQLVATLAGAATMTGLVVGSL